MKPPSVLLDDIVQLDLLYRLTVPPAYEDENGHMNVRYYLAIFDEAGYPMIERFGLTPEFHAARGTGGFDMEHHVHYLNEVRIGDEVAVYLRAVGRTAKRVHYLMFMVNETRQNLAAIFECVNTFVDLTQRRTAPYPPEIVARIDAVLRRHQALAWEAPVCGVMSA